MPILDENMQPLKPGTLFEGLAIDPTTTVRTEMDFEAARPDTGDIWGAAWRTESPIGSFFNDETLDEEFNPDRLEEGFDIVNEVIGTKYEEHFEDVAHIRNAKSWQIWKSQFDREQKDKQLLAMGGLPAMVAQFGAGLVSPTTLLPGGSIVRAGKLGYTVGRSALSIGASAGASALLDEVALHNLQTNRETGESVMAVGGTVLLGALLGAGMARYLTNSQINSLGKELQDHIYSGKIEADQVEDEILKYVGAPRSGGAAANVADSLENNSIAGKAAQKLSYMTLQNPLLRALRSPSREVREAATRMMENPIYLKKNMDGHASQISVESAIKEWDRGALARAMTGYREAYSAYRKGGGKESQAEFAERVSKAMRRGDKDLDGDLHVEQAAKLWRETVFDPLKDLAIEAGLLPEGVSPDTAISYLSRIYNKPMIEADEAGFKTVVREWAGGVVRDDIKRARSVGDRRLQDIDREIHETKLNMLREEERFNQRTARTTANDLPDELEADDVLSMVNIVKGPKPEQPEGLVQWLHRRGGLYDDAGELVHLGINNKSRPGFVKKERRGHMTEKGGWDLDTAAGMAWEEGFIRTPDRPTVAEFLDALADDFNGYRVVREADAELAMAARNYDDILRTLDELGIDPFDKGKGLNFSPRSEPLASDSVLRRVLDARRSQMTRRIDDLEMRRSQIEDELSQRPRMEDDIDFDELSKTELEDEIEDIVSSIWRKVTGRIDPEEELTLTALRNRLPESKRGPVKERTFNIPDELIEPWLENNIEAVGRRYVRVMSADVELTRNFGTANLEGVIAKIQKEYEGLRALETDPKVRQELSKREKADIDDINAVRDLLRGQFEPDKQGSAWARIVNQANIFNFIRALGGVTISSLPDVARPMMVHGLKRYFGDGMRPVLTRSDGWKQAVREAKIAGAVVEKELNSRLATWSEIADPYSHNTPFEAFMQNTATVFSKATLLTHWNDWMKSIASVMTQNRMIENLQDMASLSTKEKRYMAYLGIDEATSAALQAEIKQHAKQIDGVWVANTDQWKSKEAVRLFRAAMNKDVDSIIVTKGIGDVPVFAHTPTGRLLLQFKSFGLAAHQRVLMRGIQEDKKGVLAGIVFAVTVGAAISAFKNVESNRDVSDNPGSYIAEGLDRSGLLTVFFELNNIGEKLGMPGIYGALQSAFPDKSQKARASRYASRNVISSMLGPSMGPMEDFARLIYSLNSEKGLTPGDITAIRRLMPFSTLPYIRWLLEYQVMPPLKEAVR